MNAVLAECLFIKVTMQTFTKKTETNIVSYFKKQYYYSYIILL